MELDVAIFLVVQVVFHGKWHIRSQTHFDLTAQRSCLGEVVQVPQCKGRYYRLMYRDRDYLLELVRVAWLQHDVATTKVSLHAELYTILACTDLHRFSKLLEVLDNLQKLS